MPETKVILPTAFDAYECDGPTCREVCESYSGHTCKWVQLEMPHDRREQRFFCSWSCHSERACRRPERLPLQTRRSSVPRGLPF
jgi:hypothetical protein